ncbi:MAG: hypothetical protein IIY27_00950 [Aeriscardovia sp.]|nr:hypothetical protein [Aeriscardovia sp.]
MKVESPGKLYLCGEYAVLNPGSFALVAPTKRKLWVEAKEGDVGFLSSSLFSPIPFSWQKKSFFSPVDPEKCFSLFTVRLVEGFCRRLTRKSFALQIKLGSDLEEGGKKLGFGSSAAMVCALTRAICLLYGAKISEEEMLKLALLAHFSWQRSGSGGDVAACLLGPVFYSSFDQNWLSAHLSFETVFKRWPGLFAEKLRFSFPLSSLALWSGQPASTSSLIRSLNPSLRFVSRSNDLCLRAKEGIEKGEADLFFLALRLSRYNLESFSKLNRIPLESREVRHALRIADALGVCAKTSGAGGGDCALALGDKEECSRLCEGWREAGFRVLGEVLSLKEKND